MLRKTVKGKSKEKPDDKAEEPFMETAADDEPADRNSRPREGKAAGWVQFVNRQPRPVYFRYAGKVVRLGPRQTSGKLPAHSIRTPELMALCARGVLGPVHGGKAEVAPSSDERSADDEAKPDSERATGDPKT